LLLLLCCFCHCLHLLHLQRLKAELAKKKKAGRHLLTKPVNQASQKAHGSLAKVGSSWLVHVAKYHGNHCGTSAACFAFELFSSRACIPMC
jgi:hypothetical protein